MAQPYNLTNISASRDFLEVTKAVNTLTGDLLGLAFLIMIFAVTFIASSHTGIKQAMGYSLFMCFVLAFFLQLLGMLSSSIFIIVLILLGAYVVWIYIAGDKY